MKNFALLALILPLTACAPVTMGLIDGTPRPEYTGEFNVIHPDQKLERAHKELAVFTYECGANDAAKQIELMVKKARKIGAQALVLRNSEALTQQHRGENDNWCNASAIIYTP
jgi:hypothetical protein